MKIAVFGLTTTETPTIEWPPDISHVRFDDPTDTARRLVSIRQVHGTRVLVHTGGWEGWLRAGEEADGHIAAEKGIALAVGVADCVPVFIAHPSGVVALLHSGWRGTAARITTEAIAALARYGLAPDELAIHLGPAICGRCYEVSADVREQLTGETATRELSCERTSGLFEWTGEQ